MRKKITLLFLLWRGLLFVPLVVSHLFLVMRPGYHYTLLPYFTKAGNSINHFLLYPWGNFDGIYYLLIAAKGYTVNAGFFPLFPLTIRFVSNIFGTLLPFDPLQYLTAHFLVNLFCFLSLVIFYKLLRLDYSEKISFRALIFLLFFPTAFFFATLYTESLFLLLAVSSFYFARKRKWFLASICAGLLGATRVVGIAIVPVLVYEFFLAEKAARKNFVSIIKKSWALLLSPLGLAWYMWFNMQKWGDPLYFIKAQGNLQNNRSVTSPVLFPQTLFRYIKIFLTVPTTQYEWWIALLEVASFIGAMALLYIAWKKRVRLSYILFSILVFLVPTSTGTFTGLPRYILVLFPIYMALALVIPKKFLYGYIAVGFTLQGILLALFSQGYFIA